MIGAREIVENLTYVQDRLKDKCTTVLTRYPNGKVSFGVYCKDIHKLWEFCYYDTEEEKKTKLSELKSTFGL